MKQNVTHVQLCRYEKMAEAVDTFAQSRQTHPVASAEEASSSSSQQGRHAPGPLGRVPSCCSSSGQSEQGEDPAAYSTVLSGLHSTYFHGRRPDSHFVTPRQVFTTMTLASCKRRKSWESYADCLILKDQKALILKSLMCPKLLSAATPIVLLPLSV